MPPRPDHSDFIGELCVALAHRWERERRFMILTGYFDESGTHGGDVALMAGFLGEARQWRKFEKRTGKLFRRFRVNIFHATDLRRGSKEFAEWSVDRKIEFLDELQHIANETLEQGFVSLLRYDDYKFYEDLSWPKGTRKDSLYTILFRSSLAAAIDGAVHVDSWRNKEPTLNVVLEGGHRNAEDAVRVYEFFGKYTGGSKALAGLTFRDKKGCVPLAAADMLAYNAYRQETNAKPIGVARKPTKSEASYRGNCYRIPISREVLADLHQQAVYLAKERTSAPKASPEQSS